MDISEEKRIADATAKEIAELEALKNHGYVMVPVKQFERLVTESFSYRLILTKYQECTDPIEVISLLDGMISLHGGTTLKVIREKMNRLMELRQELNGQHDSMPEVENKAGDPE